MLSEKVYKEKIGFLVDDMYRLELKWSSVSYNKGFCYLKGAYFCGPTIKHASEIQSNNFMLLDFFKQYYIFASNVYIVNFKWGRVNYDNKNNKVNLFNACLEHTTEINKVPKIRNKDYIVINTKGHDEKNHMFNPTYKAMLVNELGEPYNFWNVEGGFLKRG